MSSYTVYITKSDSAVLAMTKGFKSEMRSGQPTCILDVWCGYMGGSGSDIIPEKYHSKGKYFCVVEKESDMEGCEIIIC